MKIYDLLDTVYSPSLFKYNTLETGLRPLQGGKTKFLGYWALFQARRTWDPLFEYLRSRALGNANCERYCKILHNTA
jgi:hypothetical protein